VEWPPSPCIAIGDSYFSLSGVSASGAPIYSNADGKYLYWDASCNGNASTSNYWIMDNEEPDKTVSMDLDADGDCSFYGYHATSAFHGVPLGNVTWTVACGPTGNLTWTDVTVGIAYTTAPAPSPTPGPTLPPGVPCVCDRCGGFLYMDTDGDSCISQPEAEHVGLADLFDEMDTNGDGCVNQTECEEANPDLPTLPKPNADCPFGHYVPEGASVCSPCPNGQTRRRRSEKCDACPAGWEDLGDFDNCISGMYLLAPFAPGDTTFTVNDDLDRSGNKLTKHSVVRIATRNPLYYQRLVVSDVIVDNGTSSPRLSTDKRAATFTFDVSTTPAQNNYVKYDPVIVVCTGSLSSSIYSEHYPCGCGVDECELGELCEVVDC